jgi:serine protease Do
VNKITYKSALFFLLFFCIGVALFNVIELIFAQKSMLNNDQTQRGTISEVAARVSPSVVGITNLQRSGSIFDYRTSESTGSGVILDEEGYIVTNNHVVKGADRLLVTLIDGNEEEAEIIGTDPRTDLAVIKIKVDNHVTPAKLGDSDRLVVGEEVLAIGNPLGLRFARSVTAGVISGLNRLLTTEEGFSSRLIQTDAAINPGNSGGALFNLNGEVIGINSVKIAAAGFEGMGFSIPVNQVEQVIEAIKKNGKVDWPVMGVRIIGEIGKAEADYFELPDCCGVIIVPDQGSPAARAGIKPYDIIIAIDNKDVATGSDLQEIIASKKIGQTIRVKIARIPQNEHSKTQIKTYSIKLAR